MGYLILPPLIVVLCLSFLLWYLSRKGIDPVIAEKMSHLERAKRTEEKASFLRTKEFILRILEKITQRFKVQLLRTYNALNDWAQSIKAYRLKVLKSVLLQYPEKGMVSPQSSFKRRFLNMVYPANKQIKVKTPSKPIFTEGKEAVNKKNIFAELPIESLTNERPMVSATAVEPEVKRERIYDISLEKNLIARIATNPKDFVAYEELGDQYLETGNVEDAKECYRQVLKLSPAQRMVKIKIRRLERLFSEQKTIS